MELLGKPLSYYFQCIPLLMTLGFGVFAGHIVGHLYNPCNIMALAELPVPFCENFHREVGEVSPEHKLAQFTLNVVTRIEAAGFATVGVTSLFALIVSSQRQVVLLGNAFLFAVAAAIHMHHMGMLGDVPDYVPAADPFSMNLIKGDSLMAGLSFLGFLTTLGTGSVTELKVKTA